LTPLRDRSAASPAFIGQPPQEVIEADQILRPNVLASRNGRSGRSLERSVALIRIMALGVSRGSVPA